MTKIFNKTLPNPNNVFCPTNIPMRRAVLAHTDALRAEKYGKGTPETARAAKGDLSPSLLPLRRAVAAHMSNFRNAKFA